MLPQHVQDAISAVLPDWDETVPRVILDELPDAIDRALKAGARPPLRFLGAGMTAIVLGDKGHKAFKVGRHPGTDIAQRTLTAEAEWLQDANEIGVLRNCVVRFVKFYPYPLLVIVNYEVQRTGQKPFGFDL